jgi:calnexin
LLQNPAYKGKWSAPMIDNPAYKGEWKPREIPNPDHVKDDAPLTNIGKVSAVLAAHAGRVGGWWRPYR